MCVSVSFGEAAAAPTIEALFTEDYAQPGRFDPDVGIIKVAQFVR